MLQTVLHVCSHVRGNEMLQRILQGNLILQIQYDTFCSFRTYAWSLGDGFCIPGYNGKAKIICTHDRKNSLSSFRTDTIYGNQLLEDIQIILTGKSIQAKGVFSDAGICIYDHFISDGRNRIHGSRSNLNIVSDLIHFQNHGILTNILNNTLQICVHNFSLPNIL